MKNERLIHIYRNYVDLLYYEREKSCVVGTFLGEEDAVNRTISKPKAGKKLATTDKGDSTAQKDIRSFFTLQQPKPPKRSKARTSVVELSDSD